MDKRLWNAIHDLLDAADFALKPLDRYSDYEDDPLGPVMVPNAALTAHSLLSEMMEMVANLMPPHPDTPMETAVSRAEYLEDR
jgi:hypothetical protein